MSSVDVIQDAPAATAEGALRTGMARHQAGDLAGAEQAYRAVLKQTPGQPDALHLLGVLAYQVGKTALAAKTIQGAMQLKPDDPGMLSNYGLALRALGKPDAAVTVFERALTLKPGHAQATSNLQETARRFPYARYQARVNAKRRSPYLDYPSHVHMETMAVCNAKCDFCPYVEMERRGAKMPDSLIDKVISDLEDVPKTLPFQLSPFKVNEPFLDVRIFDVLHQINEKLPQASITLTSNASPITEKTLDKLEAVRNIGYLWLSVNDHRADAYEKTMQIPFARTLERLQLIHDRKQAGRFTPRVVLSRVGDRSADDAAFIQWVRTTFPAFETSIFPRGDWIGQVDTETGAVPDAGCSRWFELSIMATGVVAHCCMDGRGEYPIGDVTQTHVLEVYNAPEYRKLRERTEKRQSVSPCDRCAFL